MHRFFENFYDWWKNIDKFILFLISVLFFLGLFFSLVSTSLIASDKLDTNSYYFFIKHLIFIGLGALILFFLSILKEDILIKISLILFFITLVFLLMVPFVGIEVKGSKRWLDLGVLPRFQPIELLKPYFIVFVSIKNSNERIENFADRKFDKILNQCYNLDGKKIKDHYYYAEKNETVSSQCISDCGNPKYKNIMGKRYLGKRYLRIQECQFLKSA